MRRRFNGLQTIDDFLRHILRQQLEDFTRPLLQGQRPRFDLLVGLRGVGNALHARDKEVVAIEELQHAKALLALADDMVSAVGRGDVAQHVGGGADPVQVVGTRLFDLALTLQQHAERALVACGKLGGGDRANAADGDRNQGAGEQHHVAHRQDNQRIIRQRPRIVRNGPGRRIRHGFHLCRVCGGFAVSLCGIAGLVVIGHRVHFIFLMVSTRQPSLHRCESSSAVSAVAQAAARSSRAGAPTA